MTSNLNCRFSHDLDAGKKRGNAISTTNQSCWFCLSSPNIDSHLVVSIGENFYCAIAKGPLVEGHVLVIPIEHLPSSLSLPPDADGELQNYKNALKRFFRKQGNSIIVFERYFNLRVATHAHLQVGETSLLLLFGNDLRFMICACSLIELKSDISSFFYRKKGFVIFLQVV